MAQPRLITPLEMAVLAWPSAVRPEELGPGRTSLITRTATGGGVLTVAGAAFDAHAVRIQIVTSGEPGVATFRAWTDGATWGDTELTTGLEQPLISTAPDTTELTEGADTGLRLTFTAGTVPSFNALDQWVFTTKPVQAIVAAILSASAAAIGLLGARYQGLTTPGAVTDTAIKQNTASLARLILAEKRGIDPDSEDGKLYILGAARARKELIEIAMKETHPAGMAEGSVYAPDVYEGGDRYGISAAHRAKGGARP